MSGLKREDIEFAVSRLGACMASRDLSQIDFAKYSGVEQSTISKILARKQVPSPEILQRLFAGLGLQFTDVLRDAADCVRL